jgi:hypothetical protein
MIERQRHSSLFGRRTEGSAPPLDVSGMQPDWTPPEVQPPPLVVPADEPTILGFPAVDDVGDDRSDVRLVEPPPVADTGPESQVRVVTLPRADPVAGIALVLAGIAAVASLWWPWRRDQGELGWSLARRGLVVAGSGVVELGRSGLWQPLVILFGGGLLLLLGIVLFLPERTHRIAGVLALVLAGAAATGVVYRVADAGWNSARFGPGMWLAIAVPSLGLLGALKAMLTTPRVTLRRRQSPPEVG